MQIRESFFFQINENTEEGEEIVLILSTNLEDVRFRIRSTAGQSLEKNLYVLTTIISFKLRRTRFIFFCMGVDLQ